MFSERSFCYIGIFNYSKINKNKNEKLALKMTVPLIIVMLLLIVYPIIYSFWISLFTYKERGNIVSFVGLKNYILALQDLVVLQSIGRTFYFAIITTGLIILIGLIISLIMNEKFFGRDFCKALLIVPWALPEIVCVVIWAWIFNSEYGVFNFFLKNLNLISSYQTWLGSVSWAMPMVILIQTWKNIPMVILLFMAGLDNIPTIFYEAAKIDGANRWQSFWYITFPFLKPYITVNLVMQTVWAFRNFTFFYGLTGGGPINKTMVLSILTYKNFFKYLNFGYGSALGYFMLILVIPFVLFYIKVFSFGSEDII